MKIRHTLALGAAALTVVAFASSAALAAGGGAELKEMEWHFDGPMGKVDKRSAQRGFQVYREVCAACHGMKRIAFRNLVDLGFSEAEVKALAAEYQIEDGPNDDGDMFMRPGKPSDFFPEPYPNQKAAEVSNGGAYPPDLSLIVKAREDGANYLYSLLTGYEDVPVYRCNRPIGDDKCKNFNPLNKQQVAALNAKLEAASAAAEGAEPVAAPKNIYRCSSIKHEKAYDEKGKEHEIETCVKALPGLHYNPYFPGHMLAMPKPLSDGQVGYEDDTKATVDQMAYDVTNFLQWAAEPEMEARKQMGIKVLLYLLAFTVFMYIAKRRIWSRIEH